MDRTTKGNDERGSYQGLRVTDFFFLGSRAELRGFMNQTSRSRARQWAHKH